MAKPQAFYPLYWIALSIMVLASDYLTGPAIQFPIAFTIPVVLASWYSRRVWGVAIAVLLPAARIGFNYEWGIPPAGLEMAVNYIIRVLVLTGLAYAVDYLAALTHEVKVLQGILPICSNCKRIRGEDGSMETDGSLHIRAFRSGVQPRALSRMRGEVVPAVL